MKVLWISHFLPYPPKGGVLQRGYYLIKELSKYAEVDLLAFNQPRLLDPLLPNEANPKSVAIDALNEFVRVRGVVDVPLSEMSHGNMLIAFKSLVSRYPYNINWLISPEFKASLISLLEQEHYDVVHFDTIGLAYYLPEVKRLCPDARISLGHHNVESHMLLRRAKLQSNILKKVYFLQEGIRLGRYERAICPKFDLNITCSDLDSDRLRELGDVGCVETIENGVDIDYFVPSESTRDPKKLIFIGTMNWYPNVDAMRFFVSDVWPLLTRELPDLTLDIIGAAPPEEIRKYAEDDSRIRVHGFVDDIRPYMSQAGIYVCPIRDGGGTKLKVLDAFSSGIPMVAHPIACEGIAVEDGRDVVLASTPDEFMNGIKLLVNDSEKRHSIAAAARRLAEAKYSFASIGKRLYMEFDALMPEAQSGNQQCVG